MNDKQTERRRFLTASAGSLLVAGFPAIISGQSITKAIRVGLIGCGGRGTGAASQALHADEKAELVSVADVDPQKSDKSLATLKAISKISAQVKVDPSKQFVGLDAYHKVISSDVDVVLLATPPAFRPVHLADCVEKNKHIFCEKPVATDAPGVRSVLRSAAKAKERKLSLVGGLCWRYNKSIQETFHKISEGAIGRLTAYHGTYFSNSVKPMLPSSARPAGMSDTEWQIRNWYNFYWLSGDGYVEQGIHTVDKIAWAMHDQPPVSCIGTGGRAVAAPGGNIFDHFQVSYTYPGGVRAFLDARQIDGCYNENTDSLIGTDGTCIIGRGPLPFIDGKNKWTWSSNVDSALSFVTDNTGLVGRKLRSLSDTYSEHDMYQHEHDVLFASIRKRQPVNDGERMANSTMLAIMGRMAAYTGQQITWDEALNSQEALVPEKLDWHARLPTAPRAQPGLTKFI